jgi:hypothetical protein
LQKLHPYMYVSIYMYTPIYVYIYTHTHKWNMNIYIYVCMYTYMYHVSYVYPLLAHKNWWISKSRVHNFVPEKEILQNCPPKKHRETLIGTTALGDHPQITKWEISKVFKKREDGHATYTKERKQYKKQTRRHVKKKEQNNDRQKGEKIIRDKTEL